MLKMDTNRPFCRAGLLCLLLSAFTYSARAQVHNGDIVLTTQAAVDNFAYQQVTGTVYILGNDIQNLDGLAGLTQIGGGLFVANNPMLTNVDGLADLSQIDGALSITNNASLLNLDGLSALEMVGGNVEISNNVSLLNVDGLASLKQVTGKLDISWNAQLAELNGFPMLTSVGEKLLISNNAALLSIDGFTNLQTIGGDLDIRNNDSLTSIGGFSSLLYVNLSIIIQDNDSLAGIGGFGKLVIIGQGGLRVAGNNSLQSITGFTALTQLGGSLEITDNEVLAHIDGLAALRSLGGRLYIEYNRALTSINSLAGLAGVGGDFIIANNGMLNDCCVVFPLLQLPFAINGETSIYNNAQGCNNEVAICAACTLPNGQPVARCRSSVQVVLAADGSAHLTLDDIDNNSSVSCGMMYQSLSHDTFSCADLRPSLRRRPSIVPVTLTVSDGGGNSSSCVSRVEIIDNIAPEARCRDLNVSLPREGQYNLQPALVDDGSGDACSIQLSLNKKTFTCADLGPNVVQLTAKDPSGNSASCLATVTVYPGEASCGIAGTTTTTSTTGQRGSRLIQEMPAGVATGSRAELLRLYPNPANEGLTIELPATPEAATLTVQDQLGRTVWSQALAPQQAAVFLTVDGARFPAGLYLVRWQDAEGRSTVERLVVSPH